MHQSIKAARLTCSADFIFCRCLGRPMYLVCGYVLYTHTTAVKLHLLGSMTCFT